MQIQLAGHRDHICLAPTRTCATRANKIAVLACNKIAADCEFAPFLTSGMAAPQDLLIPSVPKKADQFPSTNSGPPNCPLTDPKVFPVNLKHFIITDVHYHKNVATGNKVT